MNEWLEILIILAVVGSTSVACILVVNPIAQKRFSANWHYSIRKLAVFFYLVPVIFMVQMFPIIASKPVSSFRLANTYYWGEIVPGQSISMAVAVGILSIWGVGAVLFGGWQLYCYRKFTKDMLRKTILIADDSEVYKLLASSKKMLGVKGKVKLSYNVTIASPALVGLLQPTILLPIRKMSAAELDMVFHHELIHFKRKDLWVKQFV